VPAELPAVVSSQLGAGPGATALGLGGDNLTINAFASASAIPGAPGGGVIVDRTYAERNAADALSELVERQVWVAAGAQHQIESGLRAAGVKITSVQKASTQAALYDRQGPGLASAAFLIDALAAALLAAGGALTTLASAARRRRFEYAALGVVGAGRRSLYAGLLIEQVGVLLFGAVAGAAAGIGASLLALRNVPEFVTAPTAVPLSYPLPAATLTVFLGATLVALLVTAAATSAALLAGSSPDRLREIQE
jgi:putative ABC transport system permease protein